MSILILDYLLQFPIYQLLYDQMAILPQCFRMGVVPGNITRKRYKNGCFRQPGKNTAGSTKISGG
ncbi:hypothetical protein DRN97_07005 [Methanosarcinales archaeon]|nr:MAG: hypothetical protein DRN97_07005 [Methanosarcinales archaeon]